MATNGNQSILTLVIVAVMICSFTALAAAQVQQETVVNAAVAAFERLCGESGTRNLDAAETQAVEVFRVDTPEDLSRPISWEAYPDSFIVPIAGSVFRKLPEEYWASAGAALERLHAASNVYGVWERGIAGQVYCEADGSPYRIVEFERPAAAPIGLRVYPDEVARIVDAAAGSRGGTVKLLDMGYQDYVWEYDDGDLKCFVDAKAGTYFSREAFEDITRENWSARASAPADAAGSSSSFSLAHVAREQDMYQAQNGMQCWPTSMSMVFDFFGQCIFHEDVADVAMSSAPGAGTVPTDACRAAMFSYNSAPHTGWCHHTGTCPLVYGYNERALGYSAVYHDFSSSTAFNCVQELTREHTPILTWIFPPDSSHIVVVFGYETIGAGEHYVSVFDPNNFENPDTHQVGEDWWRWETDESQPDRKHDFYTYWGPYYRAMLATPLPVTLELSYDSQNDEITIAATVRTCWEFPAADTGNTTWDTTNLGATLSGSSGSSTQLQVSISYPGYLDAPAGSNPYLFWPSGVDASSSTNWVFDASDPDVFGARFDVSFAGWARNFASTNYSNQTDELGGGESFTLDRRLFRITDSGGNLVAAMGDEGNLYLAGSRYEFEDSITQDSQSNEFYIQDSDSNPVCLIGPTGNLKLLGLMHANMNDIDDSCTGIVTDASSDFTSANTVIPITDYTRLPANPSAANFYVRVHNEIMRVTDSSDTFGAGDHDSITVVRGQEGTTAVAHENGSQIWLYAKGDLQAAITLAQTSLALESGDASMFPSDFLLARRFPIRIDNEYLLVTAVANDTFTIQRGWRGSTAAAHSAGADVVLAPELAYDEEYYLEHPASNHVFRIQNSLGETVAYTDDEGEMRLRGLIFENFSGWGLWD